MAGLFTGPSAVRKQAASVAVKFGIKEVGPALLATVTDEKQPAAVRAETLLALHSLKDANLDKAVKLALADKEPTYRTLAESCEHLGMVELAAEYKRFAGDGSL